MDYLREVNFWSILVRVLLSMLIGGILGIERGQKKRPAGFRTYMLVCLGSAFVMMTNQYANLYCGAGDPVRMGAQVVSGIGFLGAGTIVLTDKTHVRGITTAAGLWTAACSGLAIGIGFYEGAIIGGAAVFVIMSLMQSLDDYIHSRSRIVEVYVEFDDKKGFSGFSFYLKQNGLEITEMKLKKSKLAGSLLSMLLTIRSVEKRSQRDIMEIIRNSQEIYHIEKL